MVAIFCTLLFAKNWTMLFTSYKGALELFDKIIESKDSGDYIDALILRAETLRKLERFEESLNALKDIPGERLSGLQTKQVNHLILANYLSKNDVESGKEFLQSLKTGAHTLSWYVEGAIFYWNIGDRDKAKELLVSGVKSISEDSSKDDLFELGNLCFNSQLFEEAANIFEIVSDTSVYSPITKKLVQALFNSAQKGKALTICARLEDQYGIDRFLAEAQCIIYESIDDVTKSIEVCNRYLLLNPDDQVLLLRLALNYNRLEQNDRVFETLKRLKQTDYSLSYESLFMLANLHFKQGNIETALEIAYETRRNNYNIGDVHFKYFGLLTEFKLPKEDHQLSHVSEGSSVTLRDESGKHISYTIENRRDILADRGELSSTDPIAAHLIGKHVGDRIIIKNSLGSSRYIVVDVKSKHLNAFQETVDLFQTRFINEPGVKVMYMKGDTAQERLSPLFESLDRIESHDERVDEMYQQGQLPVGLFSKLRGSNPIHIFFQLVSSESLGIRSVWHPGEFASASRGIDGNRPLVIDITTLMTLATTESLSILEKVPNEKYIAQTTFDLLTDLLRELRGSSEGSLTVGKINGEYVRQESTPEQVKAAIDYYQTLLIWVRDNCKVLSSSLALSMKAAELKQSRDIFDASFHDSMLIAKEYDGVLFSDDAVLRNVGSTEHGIKGINTFLFYTYALQKGALERPRYVELVLKLYSLNFLDLPCDVDILVASARKSGFEVGNEFTKVSNGLASSLLAHDYSILIAIEFLKVVYTSFQYNTNRDKFVSAIIDSLFLREINLRVLANVVASKFSLLHNEREDLIERIRQKLVNDAL